MKIVSVLLLLLGSAFGQFNTGLEINPSAWTTCIKPTCDPGGNSIPTYVSIQSTGTNWPANTLQLKVSGTDSNALWYRKVGPTSATYFEADLTVYIPPQTLAAQAFEYDLFEYISPYRYMWGSECVTGGKWQIWDGLNHNWINTSLACQMSAGWHHIQWWVHRVNGDTSCSGLPCLHYDTLGIDNVYYPFNLTQPSEYLHSGWSNDSGLNVQLDIGANQSTLIECIKKVNFISF